MTTSYDASSIEVLTGLEPVRKRPGMYTQTERPNHLVQEVVDNSVDEAIAGHCQEIVTTLHDDGSISVQDDGRGMPVDQHQEEGVSGVEVILTRLHAGAKFSHKDYRYSGGLHGVGVSVVNALSRRLEVVIRRSGQEHAMSFADGEKASELEVVGSVGRRNTGTRIRFWPDPQFFDSAKVNVCRLKHALEAKAVLCSGLQIRFVHEEDPSQNEEWCFEDGLEDYLLQELGDVERLPERPYRGSFQEADREVDWAVLWLPEEGEPVGESYVNLIPTAQGGTHVNGFRTGLTEALREFCDFRNLLPRGLKISPDDVWSRCSYILSARVKEPQFSGQTKERLSNRDVALFVAGAVKDAFSLWLNQNVEAAEGIAQIAIDNAQARARAGKKVKRKKVTTGPALPGKLADCSGQDFETTELFLVEGDSAGGSAKQARDRETQAILPLRGKILNTWEVDSSEVLGSQEVHDIAVAIGVDPGSPKLDDLRYGKVCILADADSDGAHIATLLCALFVRHFRPLVEAGRVYLAMPPLYRIDQGKKTYYALDDEERRELIARLESEGGRAKIGIQRFKGLGEMNPLQLRETVMAPDTRRLVRLTVGGRDRTDQKIDMLLARGRAADRRRWLETKGNMADV
ncbi:MAG: DNA topoisomerase IV subunit B [Acidobacteriota bacterium]